MSAAIRLSSPPPIASWEAQLDLANPSGRGGGEVIASECDECYAERREQDRVD
jgi:hypothetical protein